MNDSNNNNRRQLCKEREEHCDALHKQYQDDADRRLATLESCAKECIKGHMFRWIVGILATVLILSFGYTSAVLQDSVSEDKKIHEEVEEVEDAQLTKEDFKEFKKELKTWKDEIKQEIRRSS